jgi:outer membrane protein assembly factor BamB
MRLFFFGVLISLAGCSFVKVHSPEKRETFFRMAWAKNLDGPYESGNLPIGQGAPRIFNDVAYMGSLDGVMRAYDVETGRVLWQQKSQTSLGAPVEFFNDHIAYGGLSGRLFVRHYLSGKLKYAIDLSAPIESAPVFHQGRLFVYLRGHQIVQLDAETGKIIWVYKRAIPITTTLHRSSRPLIIGNKVIVGFADGYLAALSLDEGVVLWESKLAENSKFVDVDLNPLLVGGLIIAGSPEGELKAINPDSGAISRNFAVNSQAHPLLKNNQLIVGTNDGEVLSMALDGAILKKVKISERPISALAWWKEALLAASFDGKIRAIDPISFKIIDEFHLGNNDSVIFSDLVHTPKELAVYSSRNRLYVFK